jgi:CDP-glucose 4,6-dehydratase
LKRASELNKEFFKGKRVFVTGHTGFKGAWLTLILNELGAVSRGYALEPERGCLFEKITGAELIDSITGDVRDKDRLTDALVSFAPEIVLHLAARAIVQDCFDAPHDAYETNVMGTVNLFEAIRECSGVKSVAVITTDKVYENKGDGAVYKVGEPLGGVDPYSASKTCMEFISESYKSSYLQTSERITGVATIRASNVIAGGDHVQSRLIPSILNGFAAGKPAELRNPDQTRPWQSALDAINGYLTIARKLYEEPVKYSTAWNIGPAKEGICSVGDVFDKMRGFFDSTAAYETVEKFDVRESKTLGLDIEKSVNMLGWTPEQPLDKMLYDLTDYFKCQKRDEPEREICSCQICEFFEITE